MSSSPKLGGLGPHKCIPPCSRCSGGTLPQPQFLVGTSIPWLPWPGASHWDLHLALLLSVCLLSVCLSFDSALHLFSLGFSRHLPWDVVPTWTIQGDLLKSLFTFAVSVSKQGPIRRFPRWAVNASSRIHPSTRDSKWRGCWAEPIKPISLLQDFETFDVLDVPYESLSLSFAVQ